LPATIELAEDAATAFESLLAPTAPAASRKPTSGYQPVLSIRASIPKGEDRKFIAEALRDIRIFMHEHEIVPAGPPFSICHTHGSNLDIEAGWPTTTRPHTGTSRIQAGSLPRSLTGHGTVRY
jgi:hypothetical protein